MLFSQKIAYRVYDEFEPDQIHCQEEGDFLVSARMPVDTWLIGYLLSLGTQVSILEPAYLRDLVCTQAQKIYEKNKT